MKAVATFLMTLTLALAGSAASAAVIGENLLGNPGFESPIEFLPPPPDNDWFAFGGAGEGGVDFGAFSSTNNPRTGEQSAEIFISDFSGTFVGIFQEVTGLSAGLPATFSGWIAGTSEGGSVNSGVEIRIEWFDSASGNEIARTDNLTPMLTDNWEMFSVMDIVPAGADAARVVFDLQSLLGPAGLNVAYLDDTSFSVIPVPGALILMLSALAPLSLFRKRVA